MERTKHMSKFPSKPRISLKDIPPLDPSSCTTSSSVKPRTRMVPIYVAKQRWEEKSDMKLQKTAEVEEENDNLSTIQIDPNSTRCRNTTQEKKHVPEPGEDLVCQTKSGIEVLVGACLNEPKRASAKSQLHDICALRHWKAPVYNCYNDEGPCHMRFFMFKVVVEIMESSNTTVLECFGAPHSKKKTAAEHAAEGALWYLKHSGHFPANKQRRRAKPDKASSNLLGTV